MSILDRIDHGFLDEINIDELPKLTSSECAKLIAVTAIFMERLEIPRNLIEMMTENFSIHIALGIQRGKIIKDTGNKGA